jgi:hypothetical protein
LTRLNSSGWAAAPCERPDDESGASKEAANRGKYVGSLGSHVAPILATSFRASQEPHLAATALAELLSRRRSCERIAEAPVRWAGCERRAPMPQRIEASGDR